MEFTYWIYANGWKRVTRDRYLDWDGIKEMRPSTWGYMLAQKVLGGLRR